MAESVETAAVEAEGRVEVGAAAEPRAVALAKDRGGVGVETVASPQCVLIGMVSCLCHIVLRRQYLLWCDFSPAKGYDCSLLAMS